MQNKAKTNKEKRPLKTEPKLKVELNEEQKEVARLFYEYDVNFVLGDFGCFAEGTSVRMYDGTTKLVEDVVVGDKLMGPDSLPREVKNLTRGFDKMYKVQQKRGGKDYIVNGGHQLVLSKYYKPTYKRKYIDGKRVTDYSNIITPSRREDNIFISVDDYLKIPFREVNYQGYCSDLIDYPFSEVPIDPYYLGLWLGDGSKNNIKQITTVDSEIKDYLSTLGIKNLKDITYTVDNKDLNSGFKKLFNITNIAYLDEKYIPNIYLANSKDVRLNILAGLLDSDGHLESHSYEITQKNKKLATDIYNLIRSLGFNAFFRSKKATLKRKDGSIYTCEVYRISFTPDLVIPCKVKRKQLKDLSRKDGRLQKYNGLKVDYVYDSNFYGFEVDKDNLFLLDDYTVVHNCGKSLAAVHIALTSFRKKLFNKIYITRPMLKNNLAALPGTMEDKMAPYVYPIVQNFQMCQGKELTEKMMKDGDIEIMPIEVAKGVSFIDSVVIVDEFQDMDYQDFRTILTRLGKDSKMIFTGSKQQIDRVIGNNSCYHKIEKLKDSGIVPWTELKSQHRNELLTDIIRYIEES